MTFPFSLTDLGFVSKYFGLTQQETSRIKEIDCTAAGVVTCGGPKKSPRTSSIVQIIFSFWSFEIIEGILRNQKIIIGLDSFSNPRLIYLAPFGL